MLYIRDNIVSIHSHHHFKPNSQVGGGMQSVVKAICGHIPNLEFVNCRKCRQIPICHRWINTSYSCTVWLGWFPDLLYRCAKLWWVTRLWYGSMAFQSLQLYFQSFNAVTSSGFPTSTKVCQGVVRNKTYKYASTPPFEAKPLIWIDGCLLYSYL